MSDYLSSLAARSLRRETGCEPRRAQRFEPRPDTLASPFADGAHAEHPGSEQRPDVEPRPNVEGEAFANNFHATPRHPESQPSAPTLEPDTRHGALQVNDQHQPQSPPLTSHTSSAAEHSSHITQFDEPVVTPPRAERRARAQATAHAPRTDEPESLPSEAEATEAAGETKTSHAPLDVLLIPQTPSAEESEPSPSARRPTPTVKTSPAQTAGQSHAESLMPFTGHDMRARATAEGRGETFDEEGREETSPYARSGVEPRARMFDSTESSTVIGAEAVPQSRASNQAQSAAASTRTDVESRSAGVLQPRGVESPAEVRTLAAQPQSQNARAAALSPSAAHAVPVPLRGAGLNGVQATAREASAQAAQPPTIEVTIGRIEVRAVTPPVAPPPQRERQAPPKMSLDDYLRAHNGGRS